MSERKQPLGRLVAKDRNDKKNTINLMTLWPGRYADQHQVQMQARVKEGGEWVNRDVTIIVHLSDGDVEITSGKDGSHFLDYYVNEPKEEENW